MISTTLRCRGCGTQKKASLWGTSVTDIDSAARRSAFFASTQVPLDVVPCAVCGLVDWIPRTQKPTPIMRDVALRCLYCDGKKWRDLGVLSDLGAPKQRFALFGDADDRTGFVQLHACVGCAVVRMTAQDCASLRTRSAVGLMHYVSADQSPRRALVRCLSCGEEDLLLIAPARQAPHRTALVLQAPFRTPAPLSIYVCCRCDFVHWFAKHHATPRKSQRVSPSQTPLPKSCARCDSARMWHVNTVLDRRTRTKSHPRAVSFSRRWLWARRSGRFSIAICATCGFVEWIARDFNLAGAPRRQRGKRRALWDGARCRRCAGAEVALPIQRDEGGQGGIPALDGRLQPVLCTTCGFCEWRLHGRKKKRASRTGADRIFPFARRPWPKCPACDASRPRRVDIVRENPDLEMNIQRDRGALSLIVCDACNFVDWYGERLHELVANKDTLRVGDPLRSSPEGPYR